MALEDRPSPSRTASRGARRQVLLGILALLLLAGAWTGAGLQDGSLHELELRCLDAAFRIRGGRAVDPRIRIVTVDEAAFEKVGRPLILWGSEFARLVSALREAGAAAVALDFMMNPPLHGLPADDPVRRMVTDGEQALAQVLLGGRAVLIEVRDPTRPNGFLRSAEVLHFAALSQGNAALANLITDPDGKVREVPIWFRDSGEAATLCGRLYELATGQRQPAGSELRINYPGPPGTFPITPISALLQRLDKGEKLSEYQGAVVLIAPPDGQDLHSTPFAEQGRRGPDGAALSSSLGVEVQAAALDTLLSGQAIRRLPAPPWAALVFTLTVVAGLFGMFTEPRLAMLGVVVLNLAYLTLALALFSHRQAWWPMGTVVGGSVLGILLGVLWQVLTVRRTEARLEKLFGRYVSPQVFAELRRDARNLALGGTMKRVTVLFSDINDFTPACESRTPAEVVSMLNRYFEAMIEVTFQEGGTIKQFVGDEIMVMYGVPAAQHDQAARAVRTALRMIAVLKELAKSGEPGFYDVKIGIHGGDVVAGNVGSARRTEYAVVGDDVNLAARIEAKTKSLNAAILVSEVSYQEAAPYLPDVEWTCHGPQTFKGKAVEMVLYEPRFK